MIHLPASVRVYLATSPCDMRRSFDGLHALVNAVMQLDAFAGHLFVFANKRRDRLKILYWDRDGFAVWAKSIHHINTSYVQPGLGKVAEGYVRAVAQRCGSNSSSCWIECAPMRESTS